eukprot:1157900-Pelagomonas_calceolata.AAC.16
MGSWCSGTIPEECRCSHEAFQLLARMLEFDPRSRITAAEALHHPYFSKEPIPSMDAFCKHVSVKCAVVDVVTWLKAQSDP